ncbi:inorganic pyrophosphatase [Clostridium aquiflavi]|uniref:Inorganic pyrophosphatase n=1 Tax=Clostridium aquiflavi TaxID=3073603 RepID=A0ABU1ECT9_9CLOT|nr:inorganic pyrophosphatase [Clostridium sp. 5N-1]MDR5586108.1 inorganic pyrophosphatase [Clostridium sp. 5N-1]
MNKIVKVIIDRPLGSYHPKHKDIYYSVNYGYVPSIIAPDGEEQDAYVLGINEPIKEFIGEVAAIIHRNDDVEEKWVVVPQGMKITKVEIQEQVHFQEKYFDSLIEMLI